jgi:hypothetical protein
MNSVLCRFNALFLKCFVTYDYETYHPDAYLDHLGGLLAHLLNLDEFEGEIQQETYQVTIQQSLNVLSQRLNYNRIEIV